MSTEVSRGAVAATVVVSALMVVIDMTVANVALPNMMGALGATSDQITWVLTSFSMAEAVCIPLTGFLTLRYGERKMMLVCIIGFVTCSAACGQSDSLAEMILFRIMQGAFSAPVIPIAQSLLIQVFGPEERGKAMALFTLGVLVGPVLGPVLGGVLTEHLNWRWVFYINVPIGILCSALILRNIHISNVGAHKKIDWTMFGFMAVGIGLLQYVLSRGNQVNWFSSNTILFAAILSGICIVVFVLRSFITRGDIAPVWLMTDRNLFMSCLIMALFAIGTFGVLQLQPMMLEDLLNYPVETAGFIMSPRGIASAAVMIVMAPHMDKMDSRHLVILGLTLNAVGVYMMSHYSLEIDPFWVIVPSIVQGAGLGLVFSNMAKLAFVTLDTVFVTGASALFSLFRTIGSSIGIAIINTYYSNVQQSQWHSLSQGVSPVNPVYQHYAASNGKAMTDPTLLEQVAELVQQQASMIGFVRCFFALTIMYLIVMAMIPLLRGKRLV